MVHVTAAELQAGSGPCYNPRGLKTEERAGWQRPTSVGLRGAVVCLAETRALDVARRSESLTICSRLTGIEDRGSPP